MSTTKEEMDALHALVAKTLADEIKHGEMKGQALSNAIKFLKDNGVTYIPTPNEGVDPLEDLQQACDELFPFPIKAVK